MAAPSKPALAGLLEVEKMQFKHQSHSSENSNEIHKKECHITSEISKGLSAT